MCFFSTYIVLNGLISNIDSLVSVAVLLVNRQFFLLNNSFKADIEIKRYEKIISVVELYSCYSYTCKS